MYTVQDSNLGDWIGFAVQNQIQQRDESPAGCLCVGSINVVKDQIIGQAQL